MTFQISAYGNADRKTYTMAPKTFVDPGEIIKGIEGLQKLAGKAKLPLGGASSNYKKAANKLASVTIYRLLDDTLFWYAAEQATIMINYSKAGAWGGVIRQPVHRRSLLTFGSGGLAIARLRFVNLLIQMKINNWGYLRGILVPMVEYDTHCEIFGKNPRRTQLTIQINE